MAGCGRPWLILVQPGIMLDARVHARLMLFLVVSHCLKIGCKKIERENSLLVHSTALRRSLHPPCQPCSRPVHGHGLYHTVRLEFLSFRPGQHHWNGRDTTAGLGLHTAVRWAERVRHNVASRSYDPQTRRRRLDRHCSAATATSRARMPRRCLGSGQRMCLD